MRYIIAGGTVYDETKTRIFAHIKGRFSGTEKTILSPDGICLLQSGIRKTASSEGTRTLQDTQYVLLDRDSAPVAVANPGYAEGEDPVIAEWPINRVPRVDHASVTMQGKEYTLVMQNSQNYTLSDNNGKTVLRIIHRGLAGGWNTETVVSLSPEMVCGIFLFCRYIEQENEFLMV